MRIVIFIGVVLVIIGAGYAYAGWRLIRVSQFSAGARRIAWTALAALFVFPVGMFIMQVAGIWGPSSTPLAWPAYLALGFVSFVVTLLLLRDGLWSAAGLTRRILRKPRAFSADRRVFLVRASAAAVTGGGALATGYGVSEARKPPPVVPVEVPIAGLHPDLEGFTILQITDVHAGLTIGRVYVERVVAQAAGMTPDIIALTGDLVDGSVPALRHDIEPISRLSAVHGKFFVTGNHEYYSGVEPWVEEMRRLEYTVLLNEHVVIERGEGTLVLAGVTDPTGGDFLASHATSVAHALQHAPEGAPKILLAHQPKSIFEASGLGVDLQLSGHTHGGQFVPWNFFAAMAQPYIAGLHRHARTWIYVSRGTGYWGPPVRVGAPSEITLVRLVGDRNGAGIARTGRGRSMR